LDFLTIYGEILGKTSVVAKDTPAFMEPYWYLGIQSLFHLVKVGIND
jgi:hypothetical protein